MLIWCLPVGHIKQQRWHGGCVTSRDDRKLLNDNERLKWENSTELGSRVIDRWMKEIVWLRGCMGVVSKRGWKDTFENI